MFTDLVGKQNFYWFVFVKVICCVLGGPSFWSEYCRHHERKLIGHCMVMYKKMACIVNWYWFCGGTSARQFHVFLVLGWHVLAMVMCWTVSVDKYWYWFCLFWHWIQEIVWFYDILIILASWWIQAMFNLGPWLIFVS